MSDSRNNHYVPIWYQKGFLKSKESKLYYLDFDPIKPKRPDGTDIPINGCSKRAKPLDLCFCEYDLYSTLFGAQFGFPVVNVEIEQKLFGQIDNKGAKAIRAFILGGAPQYQEHFTELFRYVDAQKIRTIKGLDWVKAQYPHLDQNQLMMEMQAIQTRHCTIWAEGVREIVSAKNSPVGFIVSDHPITVYNYALPPESGPNKYPNDPSILLKGSQTIFPLDKDHCLILTNYEYAKDPQKINPAENRTNPRFFRESHVRTDTFIRTRDLSEDDVKKINLIIKRQARKFIAAPEKDWLYPERDVHLNWKELGTVLLPPEDELFHFGGEMYFGTTDGKSHYQDAFGRTMPENPYLQKPPQKKPRPNSLCPCGSSKKWKRCCRDKPLHMRTTTTQRSIRERNLMLCKGIKKVLGLDAGKTWNDVRATLNDAQIKSIYEIIGFLWPIDTDLADLLPRPDGTFRALYTGQIDLRMIAGFALNASLYFDEVLIQSPFLNPGNLNPEFNPLTHPGRYKQQTLNHILLDSVVTR